MRAKRILWLLNHETLSKFELPLIKDLGFEIFTPKVVSKAILQSSGSITYEYDTTLTIPKYDLEILNEYDFYSTTEMPLYIKRIINKYFLVAITYTDSAFIILKKIIYNFDGLILFRAFGEAKFKNYSELLDYYFDETDHFRLKQLSNRFIFSQCYPNLAEIEPEIFKDAAIYMPLGLPEEFYDVQNQWVGNSEKLLFFCTRIKYSSESEEVYNQFKVNFKDFDYVIAGNQPLPVDDPRVTGFLEREKLNELLKNCKVMYYHSANPRHLHYHPLEAMIAGMPVVYMDGGLLSFLGGKRKSGACKTVAEARAKINRIFSGDQQLIDSIIEDQTEILYKFSYEFVSNEWKANFLPLLSNTINLQQIDVHQKLSVFMPPQLEKSHIDDYVESIMSIYKGIKTLNSKHEIEVSVHNDEFNMDTELSSRMQKGILISKYSPKTLTLDGATDALSLMFKPQDLRYSQYMLPVDYAQNYVNSDLWLFLTDDLELPIAPIKPYGIYVEDIVDRFYGTISPTRIYNLKMASFILTNSQISKIELTKHLGVDKNKIFVLPLIPAKDSSPMQINQREEYDVIEMDINKHSYVMDVVNCLSDYFHLYKTNRKIKIIFNNYIKGEDDLLLNELNSFIQKMDLLRKNISLHVNLRKNEYDALFAHAKSVIFPHHLKNMYFKLARATALSRQVVVEDFPLYKYYERKLEGQFIYKKFSIESDALLGILTELTDKYDIKGYEGTDAEDYIDIKEVSALWGKIL